MARWPACWVLAGPTAMAAQRLWRGFSPRGRGWAKALAVGPRRARVKGAAGAASLSHRSCTLVCVQRSSSERLRGAAGATLGSSLASPSPRSTSPPSAPGPPKPYLQRSQTVTTIFDGKWRAGRQLDSAVGADTWRSLARQTFLNCPRSTSLPHSDQACDAGHWPTELFWMLVGAGLG